MKSIKSINELDAIKAKYADSITMTGSSKGFRVVVGLATCGIAAGATPVFDTMKELAKGDDNVTVVQTGCIGICQFEPVMEVYEAGKEKVTYVKMTADKAKEVYEKHIKGGNILVDYTIGANTKA